MRSFCFLALLVGSAFGAQTVLYVNPQTGDDAGSGTASKPFASLEKARDTIRAMKKDGGLPQKGVTIELAGTFAMPTNSFALDLSDSGADANAPIIYQASKNGARLIGGCILPETGFRTVTDAGTLARLPEQARGRVVAFTLKSAGLTGLAPLPDKFNGWSEMEVFSKGKAMRIARWPNTG